MAADMQTGLLLFDIREANYAYYHLGTLKHAEEGPSLGIDRSFRIAFLGEADNPMLGYLVDRSAEIAGEEGLGAALAWLASNAWFVPGVSGIASST